MDFQSFGRQRYTRRTMMKRAAGAGIAVASFSSLSALAACGETSSSGPITITSTDMPDKKGDPNGYAAFVKAQTAFEKANPHTKLKASPTTLIHLPSMHVWLPANRRMPLASILPNPRG
ncbi:MAG TPA: hypothetical protein VKX46_22290 [Ktedonobacteraceae bacterium]|nr:hypothetical protein [Ktedonobacteraceae bacterium]